MYKKILAGMCALTMVTAGGVVVSANNDVSTITDNRSSVGSIENEDENDFYIDGEDECEISFKSVGKKMLKTNPVLCFEIFGYDFIIDNDFRPWILEINNNPGLCISSPVIQKLIPRMLDDAFRLTIDKVFDTKYSQDVIDEEGKYKTKYKLDGFNDEENVFEFLCNVDN